MTPHQVTALAEAAAQRFVGSLHVPVSDRERTIVFDSYVVGWIQGVYAGANEARQDVCRRRTTKPSRRCRRNI